MIKSPPLNNFAEFTAFTTAHGIAADMEMGLEDKPLRYPCILCYFYLEEEPDAGFVYIDDFTYPQVLKHFAAAISEPLKGNREEHHEVDWMLD